MMSEEKPTSATSRPATPRSAPSTGTAAARKKAPARAATTARRTRTQRAAPAAAVLAAAALDSESRAQNPQGDDPFQSGQRIWPD